MIKDLLRPTLSSLEELAGVCVGLGAESMGTLETAEELLVQRSSSTGDESVAWFRNAILEGGDPLGDAYCELVTSENRRPLGQTYTPEVIIQSMMHWAKDSGRPARIIDPGAGSGRYLLAAAKAFPDASIIGADIDPLSTLMLRANIAVHGIQNRTRVHLGDYRSLALEEIDSPTLYIGNPPYVRHHQIDPEWKKWLLATAAARGLKASGLAGLHVHFFLATAEYARPGDYGAFITSAEWLDVNYGHLVRQLLLDALGGVSLHVLEPRSAPFADATTTGAITCFKVGTEPSSIKIRNVKEVSELGRLEKGREISRARLVESNRWSVLVRTSPALPADYIELGELCRVHRGAVTGANKTWIASNDVKLPEAVLFPSVTKAKDLFTAGDRLSAGHVLRNVIDLPMDLDVLEKDDLKLVERFLRAAKRASVHEGYVASSRKAWWRVGLREAAPILATYMARRPPAFVRNDAEARHINIAHGLYPRQYLDSGTLDRLASHLGSAVSLSQGRTYAGGLTKFEPKEMERLPVPRLEVLQEG